MPTKSSPRQPMTPIQYAVIALVIVAVSIGLLFFYVYQVPRLIRGGITDQVYYVVLIFFGLLCAAFLFGVMRTYARYTYKSLSHRLEVTGPGVVFALVVIGGFLLPRSAETFDLTVRAHGADDTVPIITWGSVLIDFGHRREEQDVGTNGEANFKGIAQRFWGSTVRVLPKVEGYEQVFQEVTIESNVLELALERERPETTFTGTLVPPPGPDREVRLIVDGSLGEGVADALGQFSFPVRAKEGDRIRLKIFLDGEPVYDDFQTLPGPVTLPLPQARGSGGSPE